MDASSVPRKPERVVQSLVTYEEDLTEIPHVLEASQEVLTNVYKTDAGKVECPLPHVPFTLPSYLIPDGEKHMRELEDQVLTSTSAQVKGPEYSRASTAHRQGRTSVGNRGEAIAQR
jgi:hypothetical protein